MDFLRIIRSLEEFLYEAMTWLLFYPRTFWAVLRNPLAMLRYSDHELSDAADQQFTDKLSPPLFLMITIVISHLIELAGHQRLSTATTEIGKQIVNSEQNLLILRSILFAIYPLFFASNRLRRENKPLTRDTMRGPFYAQCYIAAPAALGFGIGSMLGRNHSLQVAAGGLAISLICIIWYLWVEAAWLRANSPQSGWRSVRSVTGTWLKASFASALISAAVLGLGGNA